MDTHFPMFILETIQKDVYENSHFYEALIFTSLIGSLGLFLKQAENFILENLKENDIPSFPSCMLCRPHEEDVYLTIEDKLSDVFISVYEKVIDYCRFEINHVNNVIHGK